MYILYILLAVLTLLTIFTLTAKIKFFLEYKKYPGEKLYTDMYLKIGFINLTGIFKNKDKLSATKKKMKDESCEDKEKNFIQKIKNFAKTFDILKKVYSKNRWKIQKSLSVEKAEIHLKFGLLDAAQTGIATGAVWTLLYNALAFLDTIGTVKKHFFEVKPVFTEAGFISEGKFKLSVRVINAISIAISLYTTYNKVSKQHKQNL